MNVIREIHMYGLFLGFLFSFSTAAAATNTVENSRIAVSVKTEDGNTGFDLTNSKDDKAKWRFMKQW